MIIIFSVEGSRSYTEVNFFNGMNIHFIKSELMIKAFEKISNKNANGAKDIIGILKEFIREFPDHINDSKYFFIGDGDDKKDIPAMENTRNIILNYLKNILKISPQNINANILMDDNLKFEDSYRKILPNGVRFPSAQKIGTNRFLFKNFAIAANWFNQDILNIKKIIDDMTKTKNPHVQIVKELINQEK